MQQIILASQSPRRKLILEQLGLTFQVLPSAYVEDMTLLLPPEELAKHLSLGKAQDIAVKHPDAFIIAADTFVALDGALFGKPHTTERARETLKALSNMTHQVISGLTVIHGDKCVTQAAVTKVTFKKLSDETITHYIEKENILEAAGAYFIQGLGASLIEKIDGDYYNIVGLPVSNLVSILQDFGIFIP